MGFFAFGLRSRQLSALLVKNFILQKRHPIETFIIFLVPLVFCIVLIVTRSRSPMKFIEEKSFPSLDFDKGALNYLNNGAFNVLCAPENCENCLQFINILGKFHPTESIEKLNEEEISNWFQYYYDNDTYAILGAFLFDAKYTGNFVIKKKDIEDFLNMKLIYSSMINADDTDLILKNKSFGWNWQTNRIHRDANNEDLTRNDDGDNLGYYKYGVLHLISLASIGSASLKNSMEPDNYKLSFRRFSEVQRKEDLHLAKTSSITAVIIIMSFLPFYHFFINYLLMEKQRGIKTFLRLSGVSWCINWLSWFLIELMLVTIIGILFIIALIPNFFNGHDKKAILGNTNWLLVMLLFVLYGSAMISQGLLLSSICNKGISATITAVIIFVLTSYGLLFVELDQIQMHLLLATLLVLLFPNIALFIALNIMMKLEIYNLGLSVSNFMEHSLLGKDCTVLYIYACLIGSSIFSMLLASILDINYAQYFQFGSTNKVEPKTSTIYDPSIKEKNLKPILSLKRIRKSFSKYARYALNGVSLDLFENTVTVITGPNGCGKSTLLAIMANFIEPTNGIIEYNEETFIGSSSFDGVNIGYCSSQNMLYDDLTALEQFILIGRIRGMRFKVLMREIEVLTEYLLMPLPLLHVRTKYFSQGTRRKINVCMAVIGSPKLIVLDSPTEGLDDRSRECIWSLVQGIKAQRCVVMSTQSFEEAENLADHMVMMKRGCLKIMGTKQFLLNHYNVKGYILAVIKQDVETCNADAIKKTIVNVLGNYMVRFIPNDKDFVFYYHLDDGIESKVPSLMRHLDEKKTELGIAGYTLKKKTLEEAFHKKISIEIEETEKLKKALNNCASKDTHTMNQILGLFLKHILIARMDCSYFIIIFMLPLLIFIMIVVLLPRETPSVAFPLTETRFSYNPIVLLKGNKSELRRDTFETKGISAVNLEEDQTLDEYFTQLQKHNFMNARSNVLYGIEKLNRSSTYVCWYNGISFMHTAALCAARFNYFLSWNNLTLQPAPLSTKGQIDNYMDHEVLDAYVVSSSILWMFTICGFLFIFIYCKEHETGFKEMQILNGVSHLLYWLVAYIFEMIGLLVFISLIIVCLFLGSVYILHEYFDIGNTFLILFTFSLAFLPLIFLFVVLFKDKAIVCMVWFNYCFLTGLIPLQLCKILYYNASESQKEVRKVYPVSMWLSLLSPFYGLAFSIYNLFALKKIVNICLKEQEKCNKNQLCLRKICEEVSNCCDINKHKMPSESQNIVLVFFLCFIIYCIFLLLAELFANRNRAKYHRHVPTVPKDVGVIREQEIIKGMDHLELINTTLVIRDLYKKVENKYALNNITLSNAKGECLALIGTNESGKSLLLKLIALRRNITMGHILINGDKLYDSKMVSLSPSDSSLPRNLTVVQIVLIAILFRKYNVRYCKKVANDLCNNFGLKRLRPLYISELGWSDRKKLTNLLAIIGNTDVVLLDEPTEGLDTQSKLKTWQIISTLKQLNKCIVITSQDVAMCEHHAHKIAFFHKGQLQTVGTPMELKERFFYNVILTVKVTRDENDVHYKKHVQDVRNYIKTKFHNAEVRQELWNVLVFQIPNCKMYMPLFYDLLNRASRELPIESYHVRQESLEQVCLIRNDPRYKSISFNAIF